MNRVTENSDKSNGTTQPAVKGWNLPNWEMKIQINCIITLKED